MYWILELLITISFIILIPSFFIVFVLFTSVKLSNPLDNSFNEFWKFRIGRIALVSLVISAIGLFFFALQLNKMSREYVLSQLTNSTNKIYIDSELVTNDSLLTDFRNFSKESDLRHTGNVEIQFSIRTSSELIRLKLLRSLNDSNKYWVSSPDYGNGCFGEINTQYLSKYK